MVEIDSLGTPELAAAQAARSDTRYLCLTADNRLLQVRADQISAIMEGDLAGDSGKAAASVVSAADAVRAWTAGKGGAYIAPGNPHFLPCLCVCSTEICIVPLGVGKRFGPISLGAH